MFFFFFFFKVKSLCLNLMLNLKARDNILNNLKYDFPISQKIEYDTSFSLPEKGDNLNTIRSQALFSEDLKHNVLKL